MPRSRTDGEGTADQQPGRSADDVAQLRLAKDVIASQGEVSRPRTSCKAPPEYEGPFTGERLSDLAHSFYGGSPMRDCTHSAIFHLTSTRSNRLMLSRKTRDVHEAGDGTWHDRPGDRVGSKCVRPPRWKWWWWC